MLTLAVVLVACADALQCKFGQGEDYTTKECPNGSCLKVGSVGELFYCSVITPVSPRSRRRGSAGAGRSRRRTAAATLAAARWPASATPTTATRPP